jgi:uncharacterized protein (TIGR04552 family)
MTDLVAKSPPAPGLLGAGRLPVPGRVPLAQLDPQSLQELLALLRGESVVDWHRLALTDPAAVRRLFLLNGFDLDDPQDTQRLEVLRAEAATYITQVLGLRMDAHVASEAALVDLPQLASGRGRRQRSACVLLKVMHIMHHLDARELVTDLSVSPSELFALVEASVLRIFETLRDGGIPVIEFAWSRKTRESLTTKLLVKRDTHAARVFDRLRFRLVVAAAEDLVPALHVLLQRCVPFNYVVPGETVNTLVDPRPVEDHVPPGEELSTLPRTQRDDQNSDNEFSSREYRVLNFVVDLPVRIDGIVSEDELTRRGNRGRVIFVLAEFQVLDRATALTNETGDTAHEEYKTRQHQRVRERLLREPRHGPKGGDGSPPPAT